MSMTPQTVLSAAADHIEKYGKIEGHWIPNEYTTASGTASTVECPACAGGALALAVSGGLYFSPNYIRLPSEKRIIEEAFEILVGCLDLPIETGVPYLNAVVEWSDASATEDVIEGLRQAAAG